MLAIPGPSIIPERVLLAMHRASPNIYEGALIDTVDTLYPDLKAVARTDGHVAIYIANGHGAWEAALRNTVNPGETVLVLSTGRFGAGWGDIATAMGVETQVLDFGMQAAADARQVEDILRADTAGDIRAVLTVLTDTASGVRNDIAALRAAIDAAKHDALLMVDCVASLGCDRYEMDALGADVTVAACQKGLMTPPGLGFVYFNERASSFRARTTPGYYWDWVPRTTADYFYQRFGGTAPTHHIFGLREALDMLVHEEGVEAVWARHEKLASAVWAALDAWGTIAPNITDRDMRSRAVTTIATEPRDAVRIRAWCEREAGVTLGIGLGFGEKGSEAFESHFRIGHMGHLNIPMLTGTLASIDCALKALDIDHGSGAVEAANLALTMR